MKKGQEYVGIVERVDFPDKGIVICEDGKVSVKGSLPGQKIRLQINKVRSKRYEGALLEVIEKSPIETEEPACPHFGRCGGCNYQTLPYSTQLDIKELQVKKILDEVIHESYVWDGILGSPTPFAYRNKMEFSFGDAYKNGPLTLGLHMHGSFYDILTTSECKLVDTDFNMILKTVLERCENENLTYYHKMRQVGYLRHLLIRKAVKTGEILVNLVTSSQCGIRQDMNKDNETIAVVDGQFMQEDVSDCFEAFDEAGFLLKLKEDLLALPLLGVITGFLHTVNDSIADVIRSDYSEVLYGRDYIYEEVLGLRFKISTFSFFQTNSLGAEVLYSKAREYIGETKDKVIFDLYSGTGTIAQLMAPVAKKVVGVEIVAEAVEAAGMNAKLNGLENCEFLAGDVLKVLDTIEEKPDLIVLDPPRDGINPKALTKIIDYGVDRIVYISCKPTSLARDLVVLQERGYKVEKVGCIDMFPMTGHVETIVALHRKDT